ncbi:MAG: hypothetical protein ACJAUV_001863 [Flavobacteriales bacterium]|jgi:hypothetical protein
MKPASVAILKKELKNLSQEELLSLTTKLAAFKIDNKAYLSYLLFHQETPDLYLELLKNDFQESFEAINQDSSFYVRKGLRKIERELNKQAKYMKDKGAHVELLSYFLHLFKTIISVHHQQVLHKIFDRILLKTQNMIPLLHEDLQYDYHRYIDKL